MVRTFLRVLFGLVWLASSVSAQTFENVSSLLQSISLAQSGASAVDINNDGLVDLYHTHSQKLDFCRLYLNKGPDGFVNIFPSSGVVEGEFLIGGIFGDYDNDGYLDLLSMDFQSADQLYRNTGAQRFINTTAGATLSVNILTQGAGWADYNRDGRLDLLVGNDEGLNQLFRNVDYAGFTDLSNTAGVQFPSNTYSISWGDFNNDRLPDILISPCGEPEGSVKFLLKNNGTEKFLNISQPAGITDSLASWGVVWLDYNNDGYLDIYIANMPQSPRPGYNALYRNNGDATFTNVAHEAGVAGDETDSSIGVAAADFDNDGWIDIYVGNQMAANRLYRNDGDGTFSEVAAGAGVNSTGIIPAVADFNNDGWIDLFKNSPNAASELFYNQVGSNHWIIIDPRGMTSNYYGVGTRVELHVDGSLQVREIGTGESYNSQNHNLSAHFGLGAATQIDSIICRWPGGTIDVLNNVAVDQHLTFVEGVGIDYTPSTFALLQPADGAMLENAVTGFEWQEATDIEGKMLTYRLYLSGAGVDTVIDNIQTNQLTLDLNFLPAGSYRWTADVSDGSTLRASTDVFTFDFSRVSSVADSKEQVPDEFILEQNYPNPFNPETAIVYAIPGQSKVEIKIYDITGKEIRTVLSATMPEGTHSVVWDGKDAHGETVSSGVYIYKLKTDAVEMSRRMVLLK